MNFMQGQGLAKSRSHAHVKFAIVDHYWVPILTGFLLDDESFCRC